MLILVLCSEVENEGLMSPDISLISPLFVAYMASLSCLTTVFALG